MKEPEVNWRNFIKACEYAKQNGVTTAMFTGKGEPTLFPNQITKYLQIMQPYNFPFIEMQTNALKFAKYEKKRDEYREHLVAWYKLGLTLTAISVVHYDSEKNRQIYTPYRKEYPDLSDTISFIHDVGRGQAGLKGLSIRLTCILAKGYIDSVEEVKRLVSFAKANKVEQLTLTPVNKPDEDHSRNEEAWQWTNVHGLSEEEVNTISYYVVKNGSVLMELPHGAKVFDLDGQNVCLNRCLTVDPDPERMR
ncbi:MAG: hypothetical protein HYW88_03225, partial [Candidatus Sungbacteria bacterium]|nr:hypothetical protein [Candidatus Sungbacteria bacterium]